MIRLIGGIGAAALLLVACAGTGSGDITGTGGPTSPVGTGALSSAAGDAKAALCDSSSQSSLKGLKSQLANVNPNSDTTSLQTALGDAQTNLNSLQVTGDQTTLKQAALSALQAVQSGLDNPSTIAETATSASAALTALDSSLCSS